MAETSGAASLYNQAIIEEAKANVATGTLERPDVSIRCDNPLCGDRVLLDARGDKGGLTAVAHKTRGCLLTRAAATIAARHAPGLDLAALRAVQEELEAILSGKASGISPIWPELTIFAPVAAVRSRHDCVRLPLRALADALEAIGERSPA
jgi:NifU-like protein involved in Fe-S cluster formation